jgi:hypothetical protein
MSNVKPPRNPRRAYDENGNEIPPATVASTRAQGMNTVAAFCEAQGCGHNAIISLDGWPDDAAIPDMALRLHCSKCGSRKIKMSINVIELYARTPGTGSFVGSSPLGEVTRAAVHPCPLLSLGPCGHGSRSKGPQ